MPKKQNDTPKIFYKFYNQKELPELLTREEERQLANTISRYATGKKKQEARFRFISSNLRLVIKIARSYENLGLDLDDLVGEGNIGLTQAVDRFDPNKGAKFSTYAAFWIRQRIMRALSNQSSVIRMPCYLKQIYLNYLKYSDRFNDKHDRRPTNKEASKELNISEIKVIEMLEATSAMIPLNSPVGDNDEGDSYSDILKDSSAKDPLDLFIKKNGTENINRILGKLDPREKVIIERRFGLDGDDPETLEEIGKTFSVTRERIRQIEKVALGKIKEMYISSQKFTLVSR